MKSAVYSLASAVAHLLAALISVASPVTNGCARLVRVSRLRSQCAGVIPITTQFDGLAYALQGAQVNLGEYCRLGRGVFFETPLEGTITVGSHVRLNTGTMIVASTEVTIGNDCLIGEYVSIRDGNHGTKMGQAMRLQEEDRAPIHIGDDVWLGRGVVVLKGVTIGGGAIVAANSVVTKDIPENTIAAGSPAVVIKRRSGHTSPDDSGGDSNP